MVDGDKVEEVVFQSDKILVYEKMPEEDKTDTEQTDKFLEIFGVADKETIAQMR